MLLVVFANTRESKPPKSRNNFLADEGKPSSVWPTLWNDSKDRSGVIPGQPLKASGAAHLEIFMKAPDGIPVQQGVE